MNAEEVRNQALKELHEESWRAMVELEKQRLRTRKTFSQRFFPWKITIERK